ncbi:Treslin [Parasponia andersonii]|uniref:Treslin n=1 Tax=Parasponia andersonii TaxID=3476 RepID=A0A2P5C9M5_PARAD|nr:Treslin [Parasponia andersonii]
MENDPNSDDPITDYSQTQRIVLLIDLNPLIHLQNSTQFLNSILSSSKTLLSFPPLSSSLFAFKLFFSSHSPLLSSSKLRRLVSSSALSLSFDHPTSTFRSLSLTLNSIPPIHEDPSPDSSPKASCLAASMRQLVHDYAWDPIIQDPVTGTLLNCDSVVVKSNLVVLFSPFCGSVKSLSEFLNVEIDDVCLENVNSFCERFCGFFSNVNDAFVSRDIQFSWVNVQYQMGDDRKVAIDGSELRFKFFENGIRNLGWGFCSINSIVLGSALVPFGLIYPRVGISPDNFDCNDCVSKFRVQLSLEILDVAQKPLECKCCDLELVNLKLWPRNRSDNDVLHIPEIMNKWKGGNELNEKLWGSFGDGVNKLQVKTLQRYNVLKKFKGHLSHPILVREVSLKTGKGKKESSGEFFADKVLEMMATELGDFVARKSAPIWLILLSFLYREGNWALVSLSSHSGKSLMGILKPFTVSSALLFITNDEIYMHNIVHAFDGKDVAKFGRKMKNEICKTDTAVNQSNSPQHDPSSQLIKHSGRDGKKMRSRRNLKLPQDQTWSSFCAAAFEHSELELEGVYFARGCNDSKKLRFLKCWMKQIKKSSCSALVLEEKSKPHWDIQKDINDRLSELHQESEQPISSSLAGENSFTGTSRIQDEVAAEHQPETSETFLNNLSNKIQQGLESEAVELGALAQRLVNSSIYWLNKKCEAESTSEGQLPVTSQATGGFLTAELLKLLLRDPKELIAKCRSNDPSFQSSEGSSSEKIVREYELQILFRMEILRSEVGESIADSLKQKFVKHICLLLETIQCHLEGGFFGDWSLDNYVGKTIKARYSDPLEDVVHRIYTKMDLLLFADEDEPPNRLLNSEDSNQSLREKPERDEMGENLRSSEPISAEDESQQQLEHDGRTQGVVQEEHGRRLIEAQERRERARRFSSFTSWVPDLQRVWAPKQPKATKPKSNSLRKLSKRKKNAEEINDTVCETPMTEKKRSNSCRNSFDDEDYQDNDFSNQSCSSVSKALFQDDL